VSGGGGVDDLCGRRAVRGEAVRRGRGALVGHLSRNAGRGDR